MLLLIAVLSLTGCAMALSDTSGGCPPAKVYSRAQLEQAADELEALPTDSALAAMISDYAVLREQVRACQ